MALRFRVIPVTPYAQNCSLIWCDATRRAALVDPGGDAGRLLESVAREGVTLERLLLTHGHLDHVGAAHELGERLAIPIDGPHRADAFWFEMLPRQSEWFGFPPAEAYLPGQWLEQGDKVTVGSETLEVLHCPGHTPGHIAFFHAQARVAFVGDILFKGSIGRTDFPQGDHAALLRSIRDRLLPLGDDVTIVPGHGPLSTIGEERLTNPFL